MNESECFLVFSRCMNPPSDISLNILEVVNSLGKSDLEVPVEEFSPQGDPGGEHGHAHEAHRLAVHEEPLGGGGGQAVGGAGPLHPLTHLRPAPLSGITGEPRLSADFSPRLSDDQVKRLLLRIQFIFTITISDGSRFGEPGDLQDPGA